MTVLRKLTRQYTDAMIRRKSKIHETPLNRFSIRIARTFEEHADAFSLVHTAYAYLGIEAVRKQVMRTTKQHVLPEATVFVAYEGENLVGTLTVTLDSPAGLPVEDDYPKEIEDLRRGSKLVELGSLAVVKRCWGDGVTTLLNIAAFHWSINILGATDCVIGINPKACVWHRAIYGFEMLGAVSQHSNLLAPVQGMLVSFDTSIAHLRRKITRPLSSGLPLVEHIMRKLPDCVHVPTNVDHRDLTRWKLSREVFQELFVKQTDRLCTLDNRTRSYLQRCRSEKTLMMLDITPFIAA